MSQTVSEAIYEKGSLRLLSPGSVPFQDGERVRVVMTSCPDVLKLAAQVYEGLSDDEIRRVEEIALDRSRFFDGVAAP